MTVFILTLMIFLTGEDTAGLEENGRLWEAGLQYEIDGQIEDAVRIRCLLLEEALYAGHANRSLLLIDELSAMNIDDRYISFWTARLAWSCGLQELAITGLSETEGDDWLSNRSLGLAKLYSGDADSAIIYLQRSFQLGDTVTRKYFSSLDLCFAMIQNGQVYEAEQIAIQLVQAFPGMSLPSVLLGLVYQFSDRPTMAARAWLQVLQKDNPGAGAKSMAIRLLESYE